MPPGPSSWGRRPTVTPDPWEVGGEFHREPTPVGRFLAWPEAHRLYSLATYSVVALWRSLPAQTGRTLHAPDYFCPEVVEAWSRSGIPIREYGDDPRWTEPDWSSLTPQDGDVIVAVNLFGVRDGVGWSGWRDAHPGGILVEDHSHDPRSRWARESTADYAFASLRKTLPISDGAILWSPRGLPLPPPVDAEPASGSATKFAGMILKADYLAGNVDVDRETYRALQLRGEADLLAGPPGAISPWNLPLVRSGIPYRWRRRREVNVRELSRLIGGRAGIRPLFDTWPAGHCPFNAIVLFGSERDRDSCRSRLIEQRIFPPVHWPQPWSASARVREVASRLLTIPVDQRYGPADVRRIGEVLATFEPSHRGPVA